MSVTAGGTTTDLYYSADWQVLEEKVGSTTKNRYVWSPVYVDAMVLRDRDADANAGNGLEERLWVQQDANWNVTALVDGSGTVVERYAYDPFGSATVYDASYTVRTGGSGYAWVYLHQGLRWDATATLYDNFNRWYSPSLGRFTSLDPILFDAGDPNLYRYVGNGPVSRVDPSGLSWLSRRWDGVRGWWFDNRVGDRVEGGVRVFAGGAVAVAGAGIATGGTILGVGVGGVVAIPVGGGLVIVGGDLVINGGRQIIYGGEYPLFIAQGIDSAFGGGGSTYDTLVTAAGTGYGCYRLYRYFSGGGGARWPSGPEQPPGGGSWEVYQWEVRMSNRGFFRK